MHSSQITEELFYQRVTGLNTYDKLTLSADLKLDVYADSGAGACVFLFYENYYLDGYSLVGQNTEPFPVVITSIVPRYCTYVDVYIGLYNAGGTVWYDDVQLENAGSSSEGYVVSDNNFVDNGSFENGWGAWNHGNAQIVTDSFAWAGSHSVMAQITNDLAQVGQSVPVHGEELLTLSGMVKTTNASGTGAYLKVTYCDSSGYEIPNSSVQTGYLKGTHFEWTMLTCLADAPATAVSAYVQAMFYGSGEVYFDNIKLLPRRSEKYTYDENNNYIEVSEDPLKKLTGRTYNEDIGTQETFTDALNNTDNYIYNNLNQLKEVADPLTHHAYYSYNPVGNLTFTRDPRSSSLYDDTYKTSYEYNKLNQLEKIIDPYGKSISFEYDDSGNLITLKEQNVPVVGYEYNGANLLSKKTIPGSNIFYNYTYDGANNLETVTDQNNNTVYHRQFDGAGRVTYSSDYYNYQINYDWDKSNNLTLVDNDTTNELIQYWYRADSGLKTITLPNAANIFYDYDENGRLFQIRYPYYSLYPGDCKTVTYYPNGWCRRIHDAGFPVNFGTTVPVSFDYFYNDNGNINKIKSWAGTDSFTNYDSNGRLKSWNFVTSDSSIIPSKSENYDYDAAGNLITKGSDSYTYNAANRITNAGFTYYDDGNLQTDLTYKYEYDAENRLVRVRMKSDNYLLFEYTYNHDGLRVRKRNYLGNSMTQYYWDAFGHLIGEQTNGVLTSYYYDSKGTLIGFKRNNENYLYHSNLRGDIV